MKGLQVNTDFNTKSKVLVQGADFFTPQWALKTNQNHEAAFFFIHLVGLEDPPNHQVSKVKSISCECKQKWQLLVKIESDPFVNKQTVYSTKESFEKESADSLSPTDKSLH